MAIDDPISAVEKQLELESQASDPVLARLAAFAEMLNLPWPVGAVAQKVLGRLAADRLEKIELMLDVLKDELRRQENQIKALSGEPDRIAEWWALVQDGLKKAEQTRAKSRVTRIGRILAKCLTVVPAPPADDVEEAMRTATELSDYEVQLLGELVRIEGDTVRVNGRISRYDAWQRWPSGTWGDRLDGGIDSAFAKLESFGLVSRIAPPNNFNIIADLQGRYALLKKGLEFVRFCQIP
jgi:hypothetical protein